MAKKKSYEIPPLLVKAITITRLMFGWLFLYSGYTKIVNPEWTAAGFLRGAKTFGDLYAWFSLPQNIWWVNGLNEWGQLLIGISLIVGVYVRLSSVMGILLMLLYYFPSLEFPYVEHGFLIDDHIMYAMIFLILLKADAGKYWGLDTWVKSMLPEGFLQDL